jgi:uncharacterized peroxidase-related enzyme
LSSTSPDDLLDLALGATEGSARHRLRRQRARVADASQAAHEAIFDGALPGLAIDERLEAAWVVAQASGCEALARHYREALAAVASFSEAAQAAGAVAATGHGSAGHARREALLGFARTLAERPQEAGRDRLLALPAAGIDVDAVVTLAQLIGLVAFQVRVVAGLAAMSDALQAPAAAPEATPGAPFVHPAHLPPPGEPVRVAGFTSEPLDWKAWLPVLPFAQATDYQRAVLKASHPTASSSDYYLTLVRQPRILEQRSAAFNAIMYAPGGLSRAERELASTVTSRINGCVYCAAVHALRFEQLAGRNDIIVQVFEDPESAGTTPRERAIVQASVALTRDPGRFGPGHLAAARQAGLSDIEILDMIHAIAIFAWANRLMLNLGEPVRADGSRAESAR